jgi:nitrate/nitrite transporter NarK
MFLFGFICLLGFTTWESYYPFPLLNPVVWKNTTYTLCVLCVFFGYMSFMTNLFWISLYMQSVQQLSSLHIAIRLLPQALVGFIWSYIGQALVSKIPGKIIMGIGGVAYLVGAALQIFVRQDTSYWLLLFPSLCITVIGADFQFIVSNVSLRFLQTYVPGY